MRTEKHSISAIQFRTGQSQQIEAGDNESSTFTGIGYGGKIINRHPVWGNVGFDLDDLKYKSQVPILYNHDPNQIVGFGTVEVSDNGEHKFISSSGTISKVTDAGKMVQGLMAEGMEFEQSVHIDPEYVEKTTDREFSLNGLDYKAGEVDSVFRSATVREVSICPLGADRTTSTDKQFSVHIKEPEKDELTMNIKDLQFDAPKDVKNQFLKFFEDGDLNGAFKAMFEFCSCNVQKEMDELKKMAAEAEGDDSKEAELKKLRDRIAELENEFSAQELAKTVDDLQREHKVVLSDEDKEKLFSLGSIDSVKNMFSVIANQAGSPPVENRENVDSESESTQFGAGDSYSTTKQREEWIIKFKEANKNVSHADALRAYRKRDIK